MPNLVPQDMNEWMRRIESRITELTRRGSDLVPGIIEDTVDLNGFMSTGVWVRPSTVGTTTVLNYPVDGAAGILRVNQVPPSLQVIQEFVHRSDGRRWTRWYNGTWTAWALT